MEVKVSIFDILSYLLPGFLHLFSILLIANSFVDKDLIVLFLNPTTSQIFIIFIVSYILGHSLQPLYKANPLVYFFQKPDNSKVHKVLIEVNDTLARYVKSEKLSDIGVLINILKIHNEKLANTGNRFLALHAFMRNLSFPFFLLSITLLVQNSYIGLYLSVFLSVVLLVMSILSLHRSVRYRKWADSNVVEGIIALSLSKNKVFTEKEEILLTTKNVS